MPFADSCDLPSVPSGSLAFCTYLQPSAMILCILCRVLIKRCISLLYPQAKIIFKLLVPNLPIRRSTIELVSSVVFTNIGMQR